MAHIELIALKTIYRRLQPMKQVEDEMEHEQNSFDEDLAAGSSPNGQTNIQKYRRIDKHTIDYLDSAHSLAI